MLSRAARLAWAGGTIFFCTGCSLVLDLDGYRVGTDAGRPEPDAGNPPPFGPAVASFDHYAFERGAASFSVNAESGLLANDSGEEGHELLAVAGSLATSAGGGVELAPDGSFRYTPKGGALGFWGDDYFEYELESTPVARARVRLTVRTPLLSLSDFAPELGLGFGVAGAAEDDYVGRDLAAFAPAGDVNGDGLEDFVIGVAGPDAADADGLLRFEGRAAYVLFGKRDSASVALADLNQNIGFAILGDEDPQTRDSFGYAVSGAGDVNGDGLDDVVIGSPSFDPALTTGIDANAVGAAYVVFGKTDSVPVRSVELRAGSGNGFAILTRNAISYGLVGLSVDRAGDVNGDGLGDVIIGTPGIIMPAPDGSIEVSSGAHVVYGKVGLEPVFLNDVTTGVGGGFAILADLEEGQGFDVSGVGDVNGDGLDDVATGSPSYPDEQQQVGRVAVVFGKTDATAVGLAELGTEQGFFIVGADALDGLATNSGAGDVNGDGFDDIVVAAQFASFGPAASNRTPDAGAPDGGLAGPIEDAGATPGVASQGVTYVVLGGSQPKDVSLRALEDGETPGSGFVIFGTRDQQRAGYVVGSGEVNGDGLSDVIVSTPSPEDLGEAYVVFGKRDVEPVSVPYGAAALPGGLVLRSAVAGFACRVTVSGSDANGDGLDDLLVSDQLYPNAEPFAGGAYLAFGWDMTGALGNRDRALIGTSSDDLFELPATRLVIVRGGNGTDTLRVTRATPRLDLRELGRYESLELIDLRGEGPQTLVLDDAALRRIPRNQIGFAFSLAHRLVVLGDADDTLEFDMTGFSPQSGGAGRIVYRRVGAYYGLEVSEALDIVAPASAPL